MKHVFEYSRMRVITLNRVIALIRATRIAHRMQKSLTARAKSVASFTTQIV